MTNKNFSEIFSYWGEKERAISQRPTRVRRAKPAAQPTPQPVSLVSDNNNNNNNNINNNNENKSEPSTQNINKSPDSTSIIESATTTTTTISINENNIILSTPGYVNVESEDTSSPTPVTSGYDKPDSGLTKTPVNGYDNSLSEEPVNVLTLSTTSTKSRYDNVSTNQSSEQEDINTINSSSATNNSSQYNSNSYSSPYSSIDGPITSGYSQYGGNCGLVGGGDSSSNYNFSNYGGSSGYSVYNANTSRNSGYSQYGGIDVDDDENDDDDDYDDEYSLQEGSGTDGEKIKRAYIERDITEDDLILLESLIKHKARLGEVGEDGEEGDLETDKLTQTEEEDNFQSNPYISSHTAFTSSYSHPKFLTEKGITDNNGVVRSITQSSASSISKKLENISLTSWNEEFQRLLDMDDCLEKFERLSSLEHDFVYAAETYGRIIISENFLSNELKTIKPVSVGGIAGGEKYIVQGILFKFALENETFGLYGTDENAMKTAAHELNGCTSFLNCGIKGLHVPLMAFIDYRGFRLMAMSLLPISKKSLIYGSCDAGQTVHTSNTIFNHLFSNAAKVVNLKPHFVQDQSGDIKSISGPIDIEGHIGSDNRFYLLDFARLAPPEPPRHRGSYLYKLLRLELVRKFNKPLCSDAFSPMTSIDIDIHNSEVSEAYDNLIGEIIPNFARKLEVELLDHGLAFDKDILSSLFSKNKDLSKQLHADGINVRFLGEIASHSKNVLLKQFFVVECMVRTLKSLARELLRREMKKTHLPSDYPYRNLLLNFLNLIFDENKGKTELFWSKIVFEKMEKKFHNIFLNRTTTTATTTTCKEETKVGEEENTVIIDLGSNKETEEVHLSGQELIKSILENHFLRGKILSKFCKSIGLVLSKVAVSEFNRTLSFVFVDPDIKEIKTLISRLNIIDYADGMSLYYKSMAPGLKANTKSRLLTISKDRLEASLHSMSTNYHAILQLANVIRLMAKYREDSTEQKDLLGLAHETIAQLESFRIDQNLLLLSKLTRINILLQLSKIQQFTPESKQSTIELIKDCIELSPNKAHPSYLLAKFKYRSEKHDPDYSQILSSYDQVFTIDPNYQKAHIGIAIFLLQTQSKHDLFSSEKVSEHITKAFSLGNIEALVNKIKPLIVYNPWVSFESSRSIPKVKLMVKQALETKIESRGNKIVIPHDISFVEEDSYYFSNIKLEKLYLENHIITSNVEVFTKILPQVESIVLRGTSFDNPLAVVQVLTRFSNLTSINFGFSSNINDVHVSLILTPKLKKLKLFEIPGITDKTVTLISETCKELEVLDLGGCESIIGGEDFIKLFDNCKLLNKLALPPFVKNDDVLMALNSLPLVRLDLFKCYNVTFEAYKQSFTICPTLKKYRTPFGIPMIYLEKSIVTSRFTKSNVFEPCVRYHIDGIELFNFKTGTGYNMSLGVVFEMYYNNLHPLVRFRNPPSPTPNMQYYKVAYITFIDKPMQRITIYKNPSPGNWVQDVTANLSLSASQVNNFRFSYQNELYSYRLINQSSPMGITFTNTLHVNGLDQVVVTNAKANKLTVDFDIRQRVNPIDIFFTFATGYKA